MPHLCLRLSHVQAKNYYLSRSDWCLLEVSTKAVPFIRLPDTPAIASNIYLNHYIQLFIEWGRKTVADLEEKVTAPTFPARFGGGYGIKGLKFRVTLRSH